MDDTTPKLYTIGELARRTGLSVKTIRFYADSGVVPPTGRTHSGYRLYDVAAISKLELVRTLRELGAGLDDVRRVLDRETTLPQLAETHLGLVEDQMRLLRTRRAVLRAVVHLDSTTDEVRLMHNLVTMSDQERNQLIDDFWRETTEGLDVDREFIDWMRSAKPDLPDDPTVEQVEAWIELAELISDPDFRRNVRDLNAQTASARGGQAERPTPERAAQSWTLLDEVSRARAAGTAPDSAQGRELIDRFAGHFAQDRGAADDAAFRHRLADDFEQHDPRMARYWELLGTINGWPDAHTLSTADTTWLLTGLRASAS